MAPNGGGVGGWLQLAGACLDVGLDGCRTERRDGTITDAAQERLNLAAWGGHLSVPNRKIQPNLLRSSFSSSSLNTPPPTHTQTHTHHRLTVINPHADGLSGQSLSAGNDMQSTGFLN